MMQTTLLGLGLLISLASAAFIPLGTGVESTTEPLHSVVIHLGEVNIADRECDREITPFLESCKNTYHELISNVALQFGNDFSTESVKRASCCGIWEAKRCAMEAADQLAVCSKHNISSLYAQLPSDPEVKRDVLDKCSEYRENSAVCDTRTTSAAFTLKSLAIFLVILVVVVVLLLGALRLYQRKKEFDRYHESLQYNMVSRDAEHVDVTDEEVLKTSKASTLTQ